MIKIKKDIFKPSENLMACTEDLINVRVNNDFKFKGAFYILDNGEDIYYNRTAEPMEIYNTMNDCTSLNLLNLWESKKVDKNILLPKKGISLVFMCPKKDTNLLGKENVLNCTTNIIKRVISKYGDINKLYQRGNDLLYNNKKFYGEEIINDGNGNYFLLAVLTCDFIAEKKMFEKLQGADISHITGITNEIPELTKDVMIDEIYAAAKEYFKK